MAISIDGKEHKGYFIVKYGQDFPKARRSMEIEHPMYGECLIYVISIGTPFWTEKLTVKVPMIFYITQILKPNRMYRVNKKQKEINLKLVKG